MWYFQNLVQPDSTNLLTKPRVKFVRREVSVLLPVLLPVQNVKLEIKLTLLKLNVVSFRFPYILGLENKVIRL